MSTVLVVQNEEDVPLGRMEGFLGDAGASLRILEAWREPLDTVLVTSELPDALLVLGGRMNAYSDQDAPWLAGVRLLISRCIDADVPVLGICLGLQLMAVATGGAVEVGARPGPEYGVTPLTWTHAALTDPLGCNLAASTAVVFEDHADAVTSLPEGAVVLARSARYPQVVRIGSAIGVQFHPELTRDIAEEYQSHNETTDTAEILAGFDAHDVELAATGRALAQWLVTAAEPGPVQVVANGPT
jgi:GMP synthase-like glutamine amidotransferase